MVPKVGQKVTYADEYGKEFTAKITGVFQDERQYLVNIEYRRDDRSTGKVNSVPLFDGSNHKDSQAKIQCFTKKTTSEKKPKSSDSGTKPSTEVETNSTSNTATTSSSTTTTSSSTTS